MLNNTNQATPQRTYRKYKYIAILTLLVSISANAKLFNAYPGKYDATLMQIEAANVIDLYVEVWSGYPRDLRITLPGIEVPKDEPKAPECQSKLVQQAMDFTREFISNAKHIKVIDIRMENTADQDAVSEIGTEKGSLGAALLRKGLARPISSKNNKPWC
jgi:hypothetical protein